MADYHKTNSLTHGMSYKVVYNSWYNNYKTVATLDEVVKLHSQLSPGEVLSAKCGKLCIISREDAMRLQKIRVDNTTGYTGVSPTKNTTYRWDVMVNGNKEWEAGFNTPLAAAYAREAFIINNSVRARRNFDDTK